LAAFSPWIVFSFMLSFSLINAWIAFAVFIIYIAAIIFLSVLVDYVRKQNRKT
jgi:F0F1-type ATP synthase membrane subunit a